MEKRQPKSRLYLLSSILSCSQFLIKGGLMMGWRDKIISYVLFIIFLPVALLIGFYVWVRRKFDKDYGMEQ